MPEPLERVARALCRADGHPEDIKFESNPMWASYCGEAQLVLDALKPGVLVDALTSLLKDDAVPERVRRNAEAALAAYRTGKV